MSIFRRMEPAAALILLVAPAASSCSVATGTVSGGESLISSPSTSSSGDGGSSGPATWTDLYNNYFGAGGASCGSGMCHGSATDPGAEISGFICGETKDSCWMGMTHAANGMTTPIVPPAGASDPTTTTLWNAIRQSGKGGTYDNMPAMPASYVFDDTAVNQIDSWIMAGAQDN